MLGVQFKSEEICDLVIKTCRQNGLLAFYFLFEKRSMRISPPLTITEKEIKKSCQIIIKSINDQATIVHLGNDFLKSFLSADQ